MLGPAGAGLPRDIPAFDLNAACSGFVYGLAVIRGMLSSLTRPYALLIGAEVLSRVLDFTDRSTCVLFGDGGRGGGAGPGRRTAVGDPSGR